VDRYLSFGPEYWISGPLQIILAGVAISTRNEKFHAVFAIAIILQQASIAAVRFQLWDRTLRPAAFGRFQPLA
jgi:hypothetical protein